jgi:hypothetical protein
MAKIYRSALGRPVDMDQLRLTNEDVIAVGNMKVNARGDELGFGGEVVRSRNDVMNEHYNMHGAKSRPSNNSVVPDEAAVMAKAAEKPSDLRGALASAIMKPVKQLDDQNGDE